MRMNQTDEAPRGGTVAVTIADVIAFDPATGRHRVLQRQNWSDRASKGITMQTDAHGKVKSLALRIQKG